MVFVRNSLVGQIKMGKESDPNVHQLHYRNKFANRILRRSNCTGELITPQLRIIVLRPGLGGSKSETKARIIDVVILRYEMYSPLVRTEILALSSKAHSQDYSHK